MDSLPPKNMATKNSHEELTQILEHAGVRPSAVRLMILQVLDAASNPLSSQDIEMTLDTVDPSTISRSMSIFVDHNIVHRISDGSSSMKYELCRSLFPDTHDDEHVHFHCKNCGVTLCLQDTCIPKVNLPKGFAAYGASFVISGLCPKCNHNQ